MAGPGQVHRRQRQPLRRPVHPRPRRGPDRDGRAEALTRRLHPGVLDFQHLTQAKFLGGEPFLIPIYADIWESIARINPEILVSITTNGTVLNKRAKAAIESLRSNIIVSIDSLDRGNYERIRRNARFDKVMEHFAYFRDYTKRKKTALTIAFCPMQQNWWELPSTVEFGNEHDVDIYFNTVTWPPEVSLNRLGPEELEEVIGFLESKTPKGSSAISARNISKYKDVINQLRSYRKSAAA
ncbi:MAG: radical SAM protein [Hyphomicrobiales bacterium]